MPISSTRRSEKAGVVRFGREMTSALIMALIFIVYVIQAFKIPTGSMENSLLVGDFLLGLKFLYGSPVLPFSYKKFPRLTEPKPGDVVIFEYPGNDFEIGNVNFQNKDFIKRCVAGPGQVVESKGTHLFIDGKEFVLPPKGQYIHGGVLDAPEVTEFAPLRIPKKGDMILTDSLGARELFFLRNLIEQEHPGSRLVKFWEGTVKPFWQKRTEDDLKLGARFPRTRIDFSVFIDGKKTDTATIVMTDGLGQSLDQYKKFLNYTLNYHSNWVWLDRELNGVQRQLQQRDTARKVVIRKDLYLDGKRIDRYVVQNDCFFMMGDNRDNSMDSRYWGYVDRNFVKAKAFILYFSLDSETPLIALPLKIRWSRIGKLIRSWNGLNPPEYYR